MILNSEKAKISLNHYEAIQKIFKNHIRGDLHIEHFSLNLFFAENQSIFLSPTPLMAEELCKNNLVDKDSNYCPSIYKEHLIYPWRSVQRTVYDRAINLLKEEKYGMRSGMMIVRDLGDGRYAMYSFATHRHDHEDFPGQFYFLFHSKAHYIAEMGDFMYESLLPIINEYTEKEGVTMPSLQTRQRFDLRANLSSEQQIDLFERIKDRKGENLARRNQNRKPSLSLIQGGRVTRS